MLHAGHEDDRAALDRLKSWAGTLQVPPDHKIAFVKLYERDEETDTITEIGWRTYYLFRDAELDGGMIRDSGLGKGAVRSTHFA